MKKTDIRDQFPKGMRVTLVNVAIERHRERYCGRTGVVVKAVKSTNTVWIEFPDGDRYGVYRYGVRRALRSLPTRRSTELMEPALPGRVAGATALK